MDLKLHPETRDLAKVLTDHTERHVSTVCNSFQLNTSQAFSTEAWICTSLDVVCPPNRTRPDIENRQQQPQLGGSQPRDVEQKKPSTYILS